MAVERKMPGDLVGTRKKAAVKKTSVKKVSGLKYAATKKPNKLSGKEYLGYPGESKAKILAVQKRMKQQDNVVKKNRAANRVRDTKPAVRNVSRRAL